MSTAVSLSGVLFRFFGRTVLIGSLGFEEKSASGDAEGVCDAAGSPYGRVAGASLNIAQVATLHPRREGQFFLRKTGPYAAGSNVPAELGDEVHDGTRPLAADLRCPPDVSFIAPCILSCGLGLSTMKLAFNIAAGIVLAVLVIAFLPAIVHGLAFAIGILWFSGLWLVLVIIGGVIWFRRRHGAKGPDGISKGPWQGKRWL